MLGRKVIAGRPLIYATTKRFLEVFDLKNLKDLPTPKEIEEFGSALSEDMNATADEDLNESEVSTETEDAETETPAEIVESDLEGENPQTATDAEEAKPEQNT